MEKSKVYYTSMKVNSGTNLLKKLDHLVREAGIANIDFENKYTAIKIHFGEPGNLAFLRPNYAKVIVDLVKELGGKPFLTDCNTLYVGRRKNALDHLEAAYENGFSPFSTGCHVIIADGLKGTDETLVPVERRVHQRSKNRTCCHGCGHHHLAQPLQRPRVNWIRRRLQEPGHGLRLPRRQDGNAQQR